MQKDAVLPHTNGQNFPDPLWYQPLSVEANEGEMNYGENEPVRVCVFPAARVLHEWFWDNLNRIWSNWFWRKKNEVGNDSFSLGKRKLCVFVCVIVGDNKYL